MAVRLLAPPAPLALPRQGRSSRLIETLKALKYGFWRAVGPARLACFSTHADISVHMEIILALSPSAVWSCSMQLGFMTTLCRFTVEVTL